MNARLRFSITAGVFAVCLAPGCRRADQGSTNAIVPLLESALIRDDDDAKTILMKAVEAQGGQHTYSCWRRGYVKYATTIDALSGEEGAVLEEYFDYPDAFRRVVHVTDQERDFRLVFVSNGNDAWEKVKDLPTRTVSPKSGVETEHRFGGLCNAVAAVEADAGLTRLPDTVIDNQPAVVIRVESIDGRRIEFFVARESALPIKSRRVGVAGQRGNATVFETRYHDYREVQGTKIPMRIRGFQDGTLFLDLTLIEVRFLQEIDGKLFEKP